MKHILIIMKKELRRFFTDRRTLISLLLPGIMIFVLYSFMGDILNRTLTTSDDYTHKVIVVNEPVEITELINLEIDRLEIDVEFIDPSLYTIEEIQNMITNQELDLYVEYTDDFYNQVINVSDNEAKLIVLANSTRVESTKIQGIYLSLIQAKFLNFESIVGDLATKEDQSQKFIVMLVPMLLMTFLFSGAMSISTESVAGEKERGTINTLLATPVKRKNIALGKVFALSITALVSASSSFIGLMMSLPNMAGEGFTLSMYGFDTLILLFVVLLSTVLIFVVIIMTISAYAKSIKEASMLSGPLMIIFMLVGLSSMSGVAQSSKVMYFIPVYNSVQSITAILSQSVSITHFLITIFTNLALVVLGIYVITLLFNSEKVMFNK